MSRPSRSIGGVGELNCSIVHYKQTFEHSKLRSHNPDNVMVELQWSLLGIWALGLHSHWHLLQRGVLPERVSFAGVLRAYRRPMREYKSVPDRHDRLTDLLNLALLDDYQRTNKQIATTPAKKKKTPTRPPKIRIATSKQKKQAQNSKSKLQTTVNGVAWHPFMCRRPGVGATGGRLRTPVLLFRVASSRWGNNVTSRQNHPLGACCPTR